MKRKLHYHKHFCCYLLGYVVDGDDDVDDNWWATDWVREIHHTTTDWLLLPGVQNSLGRLQDFRFLLLPKQTTNWALLYPHNRHALSVAILNAWLPGTYSLIRMQSIHLSRGILLPTFFHRIKFRSSWTGRRRVVYHLSSHKHSCTPNKTIRESLHHFDVALL